MEAEGSCSRYGWIRKPSSSKGAQTDGLRPIPDPGAITRHETGGGVFSNEFVPNRTALRASLLTVRATCVITGAIATLVAIGWALNIQILKSVLPSLTTMKVNTAICLGLTAVALWLSRDVSSRRQYSLYVNLLTAFVSIIAILTICEYASGWNLGIDELLFLDPEHSGTSTPPGRLAPATAACLLLMTGALWLIDSSPRISQTLALAAIFITLVGAIGYSYNLSTLYGAGQYTSMALHTIIGFAALGTGTLAARPNRGITALLADACDEWSPIPSLLASAVLLPIILGSMTLWGERIGLYGSEFNLALFSMLLIVLTVALVWTTGAERSRIETKRLDAEKELRESEERFRAMADNIPNLAWMAHKDGDIFWYNRRWYEYTGATPAEMKGWGWQTAHHPDFLNEVMERWKEALQHGRVFEMEFPLRGCDGRFRWFLTQVRPVRNESGQVTRWFGTNTNIDDRRNAVEALRESEELARCVIEGIPDSVEVLDPGGRTLLMNQQGARRRHAVQGSAADLAGNWVESWGVDARKKAAQSFATVMTGQPANFVAFYRQGSGAQTWLEVSLTPMMDADGKVTRVLSTARDVSSARRAEEEMRETAKLESLGVMAGGIAHDFNNLLTGILGNVSLLSESLRVENQGPADDIRLAAERAADLTRQMLAYSGRGKFEVRATDLTVVVREILRLVKPSIEKNIDIQLDLTDDVWTESDPTQINQVVMNLLINAGEAMEEKAGVIRVRTGRQRVDAAFLARASVASAEAAPGEYVFLEVSDNGKGMDEATRARIFDPFFTTKFTGRGLGLAAVLGIVRGHRGVLCVSTMVGIGTTFTVLFPLSEAKAPSSARIEPAIRRGQGFILLADDEDLVLRFATAALTRHGYKVRTARQGEQALDAFRKDHEQIDAVVLDLMMPGMSGEDALNGIRKVDASVPVIVSSGYNEREVVRRLTAQKINGFLQKPYTASQLLLKVEETLKGSFRQNSWLVPLGTRTQDKQS